MKKVLKTIVGMALLGSAIVMSPNHVQGQESVADQCNYTPVKGENPDYQTINCLLTETAIAHDTPPEIVKAIAEKESGWKQFDENGDPLLSSDGGIGIMQLTNQSSFDQEKLKNNIAYNIDAGVEVLNDKFNRNDLPVINNGERSVIEHWYFAVMAYNGTKPVNSPVKKDSGERNHEAYQELVFNKIHNTLGYRLGVEEMKFDSGDFEYDPDSSKSIVFKKGHYHFLIPFTKSKHFYEQGQSIGAVTDMKVRERPSTSSSQIAQLRVGEVAEVTGSHAYEEVEGKSNPFVFYPVTLNDGKKGYVASSYLRNKFKDVPRGHYSVQPIEDLYDMNLLKGKSEDVFGFGEGLSRVHTALFLLRAQNISTENRPDPGFDDVNKDTKYYEEIAAIADEGIFVGDGKNRFNPNQTLTRKEMAVLLQRVYNFDDTSEDHPFTDVSEGIWYDEAVKRIYAADITKGVGDNKFAPDEVVTREQFAAFLTRSIDYRK
ncbi:S-layer homology domain-containing protein [Halobacillus yeomjeoni]|uniref:S-layer homology domain-containing protein n=1 Tax=Halobacillus yeomjeoni TaxID=311194 RepID=UPI001CD23009|nr:S-layer homology domain-containing protein [Halobacillus yeomjeoni]MCA0985498.1 S-layer homology domain-containing protein [Halobacillus yeomjeoni]